MWYHSLTSLETSEEHNDTQDEGIIGDIQHSDIQHNDTQHDNTDIMLNVVMLSIVMLNVTMLNDVMKCRYEVSL